MGGGTRPSAEVRSPVAGFYQGSSPGSDCSTKKAPSQGHRSAYEPAPAEQGSCGQARVTAGNSYHRTGSFAGYHAHSAAPRWWVLAAEYRAQRPAGLKSRPKKPAVCFGLLETWPGPLPCFVPKFGRIQGRNR